MSTEAAVLLNAAFASYPENIPPKDYMYDKEIIKSPSGLRMEVYRRTGSNDYIVSFRGTEPSQFNDIATDINLGWPQYGSARRDIQRVLKSLLQEGGRVDVTGHSLGGALAQFAVYDLVNNLDGDKRALIERQISLTTWNALGGVWGLERNGGYDARIMAGINARHYYRFDDIVARLGKGHVGGEMLRLDDPEGRIAGVLDAHMQAELNQSLTAGTITKTSPKYLDLYDISQIVAGELAMGILKLFEEGKAHEGAMQILAAALTLPMGTIFFLAEDLGQLLGEVYPQQAYVFLRDQGPEILAAIWELAKALAEASKEAGELQAWGLQQQLLLGTEAITGQRLAESYLPGRPDLAAYAPLFHGRLDRVANYTTPLVLDVGGDGLRTLSRADSGVRFDLNADGVPEACGWIGPAEALLVRDLNRDGRIDSGHELFGDQTRLANGERAAHGFAALAELDGNADGLIDGRDAAWSELGLWRDSDSDGVLDGGEWLSLAGAGIAALELAFGNGSGPDAQGNELRLAGHYRREDGERRLLADVWFASASDPAAPPPASTPATAASSSELLPASLLRLPDVRGIGRVAGLRESLQADSSGRLARQLEAWLAADSATRQALMPELLFLWAGVADLPSANSHGLADGRLTAALHAFSHDRFAGRIWDLNSPTNIRLLNETFHDLCSWVGNLLSSREHLSPLWSRALQVGADGLARVNGAGLELALQDQLRRSTSDEQLIAAGQALRSHALVSEALLGAIRQRAMQELSQPDRRLWLLLLPHPRGSELPGGWRWNQQDAELLELGPGDDTLDAGGGDDVLLGSSGADRPRGGAGNDLILSGDGDDILPISEGDDTICAGRGNDSIAVGSGQGLLVFNPGDGQDRISTSKLDRLDAAAAQSFTLHFTGSQAAETVRIQRLLQDLVISFAGSGDQVTLVDYLVRPDPWDPVERIASLREISFADGRRWDYRQLMEQTLRSTDGNDDLQGCDLDETIRGAGGDDNLHGWGGDDLLLGDGGSDTLQGGRGRNTLIGGSGNDTFLLQEGFNAIVYNRGDGFDSLDSQAWSGENELILGPGITANEVNTSRSGDDLIVSIGEPGSGLRIPSAFSKTWFREEFPSIRQLRFHDGSSWSWRGLKDRLLRGNEADNQIIGFSNNDTLWGEAGNDALFGRDGNDVLLGGNGHDSLNGEAGSDLLDGGDGDDVLTVRTIGGEDTLQGGAGRNQVIHYRGNALLAANLEGGGASSNSLELPLIAPEALTLERQGSLLKLSYQNVSLEGTSTIRVEDFFRDFTVLNRWNPLQFINFGSGARWDARTLASKFSNAFMGTSVDNKLSGRDSDDWLDGMEGHDLLQGLAGHDSLQGGSGNDTLVGGPGNDLLLGGDGIDTASWAGSTMAVRVDMGLTGPQDTGAGLDSLAGIENLLGGSGHDRLLGNDDANRLEGGDGDDTLEGGAGNDTLGGGNHLGGDTASYARAGAAVSVNLALTAAQNTGGAGSDLLSGLEHLIGSAHGDTLIGSSGANRLDGGGGNDTLQGAAGVDTLVGGEGADVFLFTSPAEAGNGSGSRDWIVDFGAGDRLDLSPIDARSDHSGNQAFVWIGSAAFTALGQLRYTRLGNGNGLLEGNCTGSLAADFQIELSGAPDLAAGTLVML